LNFNFLSFYLVTQNQVPPGIGRGNVIFSQGVKKGRGFGNFFTFNCGEPLVRREKLGWLLFWVFPHFSNSLVLFLWEAKFPKKGFGKFGKNFFTLPNFLPLKIFLAPRGAFLTFLLGALSH